VRPVFDPRFWPGVAACLTLALIVASDYWMIGVLVDRCDRGSRRRLPPGERGQALVEFALVLPVLMLILLAIPEFARRSDFTMQTRIAAQTMASWIAAHGTETAPDEMVGVAESMGVGANYRLTWAPPSPAPGDLITVTVGAEWEPLFLRGIVGSAWVESLATTTLPPG
jgi:hypothetical protein